MRIHRGAALLVALALIASPPAAAESPGHAVERLASEAVIAYRAADYPRAIELLERAYRIRPVAALLYNTAKSYDRLGELDRAAALYRRYADSSEAEPRLAAKAEARLLAIEAAHPAPPSPTSPPVVPRPATDPEPGLPLRARPSVGWMAAAGEEELRQAGAAQTRARRRDRIVGLTLGAAGLAMAGAAIGLSVNVYLLHQAFGADLDATRKRALRDEARPQAITADVLYVAAAASAGLGAYFLWRGLRAQGKPSSLLLVPWAAGPAAGLVAEGRF